MNGAAVQDTSRVAGEGRIRRRSNEGLMTGVEVYPPVQLGKPPHRAYLTSNSAAFPGADQTAGSPIVVVSAGPCPGRPPQQGKR